MGNKSLSVDLIVVKMTDFDVILGMNHASIDCHKNEVVFLPPEEPSFKFKGIRTESIPKVVSMMKAERD